ncbi:MAG TPA: hypothetical protein VGB18_00960, partial [Candidatus Thermoplasmatota archaeon]
MFKALKKLFSKVEKDAEKAFGSQIEGELAKEREKARAAAVPTPAPPSPAPAQAVPPAAQAPPAPAPAPSTARPAPAPTVPARESAPAREEKPLPEPRPDVPAPAPVVEPPKAPSGYKEAKRLGAIEDATRKKETIEERLTRELTQAVEQQKEIETVVGKESDRIMLPGDKLEDLLWELELGL